LSTLARAIVIATEAHAGVGKPDKGGAPYILHPLRVMERMERPEERIVAVLHDIVEDTPVTLDDLRRESFSAEIVEAVDALTRRKVETDYMDFIRRAGRNPLAKAVKIADLRDNLDLSRIPDPGPADHERMERYRTAHRYLMGWPPERYGDLNGHAVGIILKEVVRRAVAAIRAERITFEVQGKVGYGGADDMVTSADKRAQQIYLRTLREAFPTFGIVAEEDELRIPCVDPSLDAYFTIDPVDGTKALVRRQSHGIGSMIALVVGDTVVSAWVADVMTQEVYGFRPDSTNVHRISEMNIAERLELPPARPLEKSFLLLHDPLSSYSPYIRRLAEEVVAGYDVMGGSVGTWLARLWKGEVTMAALPLSHETPWDSTPIVAITQRLGYRILEVGRDGRPREVRWSPPRKVAKREADLLIVHPGQVAAILAGAGAGE
jgi:fructose-1,6-bisphosphatase/inositol monophosphatase family enzyme